MTEVLLAKLRRPILCLLMLGSTIGAFAQDVTVRGRVTDENQQPIPGVAILLKTSSTGTSTDANGEYQLSIPGNQTNTLVFSFVGYKSTEIVVTDQTEINVQLTPEVTALGEVVVIGFGTQKKVSMTSSVSTVSTEQLTARHAPNLQSSLQGMAPGLSVWDQGGEPGAADSQFRIRGVATLGNTDPLVIIDGIEQSSYDINPADIASISILKDAASTAIYGSRAANGVILITTKKGQEGDVKVNYSGWVDFQNLSTVPKHMDTESYLRLQNLAYENRGSAPLYTDDQIAQYVSGSDRTTYPLPNDWFNQVINKNAPFASHSLQISGGGKKISTLASLRYMDQEGVFPNRDMKRYQMRVNNDIKVSDKLSLNTDLKVRRQDRANTDLAGVQSNTIYHWMIHGSQFAVPRYPDGTYGLSKQGHNPLAYSDPAIAGSNNFINDNLVLNLQANLEIVKGLRFMTQYALDADKNSQLTRKPTFEIRDRNYNNSKIRTVNEVSEERSESLMKTWNSTLTYDLQTEKHSLNVLAGYSEISNNANELTALGKKFYNDELLALGTSEQESREITSRYTDWGLRSVFGRVNYGFADRYIAEFSMRYDGSSRFPAGNRYTLFPTVSAAWRISEESFWSSLKNTVEQLKFRASWGKTGNQNVGLYTYFDNLALGNYYSFNNTAVTGVLQRDLASQDLTWETTTELDFGLDATLLEGKIDVTFDWYKRLTDGILLELPIPGVVGLNPAATNAGEVQNIGWDLQINHKNVVGELRYDVFVNFSDVKNEILDLAGSGPYFDQEKDRYVRQVGYPIDAIWGYRTDGFLTQEDLDGGYPLLYANSKVGDIKYVNTNNDNLLNADDKTVLGSPIPRMLYGAGVNLAWKNFDCNIFFQGVGKQDMMIWGAFIENGSWEGFTLDNGKDYWTPENTDAEFPRPEKSSNRNTEPSDWWVLNASYLRLKNLQVGYTLPENITTKAGINNVRFYVGGTNLLTFSELTDWYMDPETPSGRNAYYPPLKTYTVGLNVQF